MDDTPFDNTLVAAFLQQLEPISLEYLEHHAGLLARFDRKYLVSLTLAAAMSSWKFGDQREFGYRSMYFDTPEHDAFHLAQTGRYRRFKVRTREYVEQGECFIEIKTPGKRGQIAKTRIPHTSSCRDLLGPAGLAFVDTTLERPGLGARLIPAIATLYRRSTLLDETSLSRICKPTVGTACSATISTGNQLTPPNATHVTAYTLRR